MNGVGILTHIYWDFETHWRLDDIYLCICHRDFKTHWRLGDDIYLCQNIGKHSEVYNDNVRALQFILTRS